MTTLVLDSQQSRLVSRGDGEIVVVDDSGRRLGVLVAETVGDEPPPRLSVEQIEELARRVAEPVGDWPTTAEMIQRIKSRVAQ
ncbi:MAG: hypothetical protein JNG89_18470 [Planctomycetaceae bacterium]|nr:hypothetical protein [Planctomycetaceae bacterium]